MFADALQFALLDLRTICQGSRKPNLVGNGKFSN